MNQDFDLYRPSEEHEMLREAVRALADDKIAPRAAEIDEKAEFPFDVYEALKASDLHAIHVEPRKSIVINPRDVMPVAVKRGAG